MLPSSFKVSYPREHEFTGKMQIGFISKYLSGEFLISYLTHFDSLIVRSAATVFESPNHFQRFSVEIT